MTTEMVERIAATMWNGGAYGHERISWAELVRRSGEDNTELGAEFRAVVEDNRQIVRAVLECLRIPTPEMVEEVRQAVIEATTPYTHFMSNDRARALFVRAIDRALSPNPTSNGEPE